MKEIQRAVARVSVCLAFFTFLVKGGCFCLLPMHFKLRKKEQPVFESCVGTFLGDKWTFLRGNTSQLEEESGLRLPGLGGLCSFEIKRRLYLAWGHQWGSPPWATSSARVWAWGVGGQPGMGC